MLAAYSTGVNRRIARWPSRETTRQSTTPRARFSACRDAMAPAQLALGDQSGPGGRPDQGRSQHAQRGGRQDQDPVPLAQARRAGARGRSQGGAQHRHGATGPAGSAAGSAGTARLGRHGRGLGRSAAGPEPAMAQARRRDRHPVGAHGGQAGGHIPADQHAARGVGTPVVHAEERLVDPSDAARGGSRPGAALRHHHHHREPGVVRGGEPREPRGRLPAEHLARAGLAGERAPRRAGTPRRAGAPSPSRSRRAVPRAGMPGPSR